MSPEQNVQYPAIFEALRSKILDGTYAYGAKLPIEPSIMAEFSVSRPTAHRALEELEFEGLAELQRGVGAFVRYIRPVLRDITGRLAEEVWGSGKSVWEPETEGRDYGFETKVARSSSPPEQAASLLGAPDAWVRERVHFIDTAPVMLSKSYYPADIVDGSAITQADTGPGGTPARLAELGHAYAGHQDRWRVRLPDAAERKRLRLPRGMRVVDSVRVCRDQEGRVVEVTEMVANSSVFVFQASYTS